MLVHEKTFREFEHVIAVARFHALGTGDETMILGGSGEPLVDGVATHGYGALRGHILPEKAGGIAIHLIPLR